MDEADQHLTLDDAWRGIQPHLDRLFDLMDGGLENLPPVVFTVREHAQAYSIVYKFCLNQHDHGAAAAGGGLSTSTRLYARYEETIRTYLKTRMLQVIANKHGNALLTEFSSRYRLFTTLSRWFVKFFNYLDRFHVNFGNVLPLQANSLRCFQEEVFDKVKGNVTKEILLLIERERVDGDSSVDKLLLKNCLDVYRAMERERLSVYEQDFELQFLETSAQYYRVKAESWIANSSTPQYLEYTEQAIATETKRVEDYLFPSTEPKIRNLIASTCLENQQMQLLQNENTGIKSMLQQDRNADLGRLFRMFVMLENGLEPVSRMVEEHIRSEGKTILDKREQELAEETSTSQASANDSLFIQSLLTLHDKYQDLVQSEFQMHKDMQKALKLAFEATMNTDLGKTTNAELMASYSDSILKTGGGDEKLSDSQIEDLLEKVVSLFSFLSDKDVFVEVYRGLLAKRLLNQRCASPFAEKSMIQKLKLKCGHHFTSKLEGMLTDLALGEDVQQKFQAHLAASQQDSKLPIDFSCEVLTTGHWPSYKLLELALPPVFQRCIEVYVQFYNTVTDHRKITWVHSLGRATVKGQFKQSYDFEVTTLQAIVMLLFNSVERLSFQDVVDRLQLKEQVEVVKKTLHSLACNKVHVLNKLPAGKKIDENDVFEVDAAFQSKIRKIKLPAASLEENVSTQRIEEDRSMAVEACIVRVMKARKRLQHNLLITEVTNQLRQFKPNPKMIKKKIEHLIERDYLARDEHEVNFYNYLA